MAPYKNFEKAIDKVHANFKYGAEPIHTEKWQGVDISKRPEARMYELLNYTLRVDLPSEDLDYYREDIQPNLPWADDHFQERVCGEPLNPGIQWAKWPWGNSANSFRDNEGRFNHNYMERYWPKWANVTLKGNINDAVKELEAPHQGIRYQYGDLSDVITQLKNEPYTRQAYLPIFFPEDTGAIHGGRVPCTLGYHIIHRDGLLHINYYMRSCEVYRHFRDDCYLTVSLLLHILDELRKSDYDTWKDVKPGTYSMYITSFHCFVNDMRLL